MIASRSSDFKVAAEGRAAAAVLPLAGAPAPAPAASPAGRSETTQSKVQLVVEMPNAEADPFLSTSTDATYPEQGPNQSDESAWRSDGPLSMTEPAQAAAAGYNPGTTGTNDLAPVTAGLRETHQNVERRRSGDIQEE